MGRLKKLIALSLVITCMVTTYSTKAFGESKNLEPKQLVINENHQPLAFGLDAKEVINWKPENNPASKYLRSRISKASRFENKDTQLNPNLSTKAKVMTFASSYQTDTYSLSKEVRYDNTMNRYIPTFWQYEDIHVHWFRQANKLVSIPNPAFTDAAHRNGIPMLSLIFVRSTQEIEELTKKEGDIYPAAHKLIEMANYFGYDGYFFNEETSLSKDNAKKLLDFLEYFYKVKPYGFHISWYDSMLPSGVVSWQNKFNEKNCAVMKEGNIRRLDSFLTNYNWAGAELQTSVSTAKKVGIDPYDIFMGVELDNKGYNNEKDTDLSIAIPEGREPQASIGLYCPSWTWFSIPNRGNRPEAIKEFYDNELIMFSGPQKDPSNTGKSNSVPKWDGVAQYIPGRSVVNSLPFITRFTTGHGKKFYIDGSVSSDKPWASIGVQDILPTWRWVVKNTGDQKLNIDFDFEDAYNGGNSLKISGNLAKDAVTEIPLYKTKLQVTKGVNASLIYKGSVNKPSNMQLAVTFEDDIKNPVYLDVPTAKHGGWNKSNFDLSSYAGKTIATIGLRFKDNEAISNYSIKIGELAVINKNSSQNSSKPMNLKLEKVYIQEDKAEAFVKWNFDDNNLWYYDLYKIQKDGTKEYIGRIHDECYYIKELIRDGSEVDCTLEVEKINLDGSKGASERVSFEWGQLSLKTPIINTNFTNDKKTDYVVNIEVPKESRGTKLVIYENTTTVQAITIDPNNINETVASFEVKNKTNGKYVYKAVLSNEIEKKETETTVLINNIENPGKKPDKPMLEHDNDWPQDGNYNITMRLWWGNNGTSAKLYENGVLVQEKELKDNTPNTQSCSFKIEGKTKGVYEYMVELINGQYSTKSDSIKVTVAQ